MKLGTIPLFEVFDAALTATETLENSKEIYVSGVKFNFITGIGDLKKEIKSLKQQILTLENTIDRFVNFEINGLQSISNDTNNLKNKLLEFGVTISAEINVSCGYDKIYVNIIGKSNKNLTDNLSTIISEIFPTSTNCIEKNSFVIELSY